MPYETPLEGFNLVQAPTGDATPTSIVLETPETGSKTGWWRYELKVLTDSSVRVVLARGDSLGTLEGGLKRESELPREPIKGLKVDASAKLLVLPLASGATLTLEYSSCPRLRIVDAQGRTIHEDLRTKGYCFEGTRTELARTATARASEPLEREGGLSWYSTINLKDVCMGLGEKAAPVNLARRRFELRTTNSAHYDAYNSDPLYKHLPFILFIPNPIYSGSSGVGGNLASPPLILGTYTPSASAGMWDLGCEHNDPLGDFKKYTQTEGALDFILSWAATGAAVKAGWRELLENDGGGVGTLIGRQWLGYLASTMGQAESDNPPAQELLLEFPKKCKKYGIPCSAMNLSSGYTVDKKTGFRMTFNWNYERYPDFEGLMRSYHRDGIKVCANIKPYVNHKHPHYPSLRHSDALFRDPVTGEHSSTQVWSGLWNENWYGSWVDMTSVAGRSWWSKGVQSLVARGIDAMWNDDNEFTIADNTHLCKWEVPPHFTNRGEPGPKPVGLVGGIVNCELLGLVSKEAMESSQPGRRVYTLTRSANVGSLQYITSSWSGDNWTSWKTLRGNVSMGLNAGVSFLHSYGDDVGGFAGPLPTPELLTRWVQSACYRTRFCIHSFKPTVEDRTGNAEVNEPWMYPEVLPHIRTAIERRYELIPYLYALSWEAATQGKAPMVWSGWDQFEQDPGCFSEAVLEGSDFWLGCGQMLVAGCYFPGVTTRKVYLPSSKHSQNPDEGYYDLHTGLFHPAGTTVETPTPLEHIAVFVRAGSAIPIGKPCVTVTVKEGLAATCHDGTKIVLKDEGGVVELDDFRGLEIFPPPVGEKSHEVYTYEWNEDDGETHTDALRVSRVGVSYSATHNEVTVEAKWLVHEFKTLWDELWVVLPEGDKRKVKGGDEKVWRGRTGFIVPISEAK